MAYQGHIEGTEGPVLHTSESCLQVRHVLSLVGDKWSVLVVVILDQGPKRFSQLKRVIDGISQRMLTLTLRNLERDGLVTRTVTPTIPPRVDYALTALGHSLCEPVRSLNKWAVDHTTHISAARVAFDRKTDHEG